MLEMPIFTAIGGIALLDLWSDGTPINSVPGETYRLTVNAMLPAIPLFALGGYILAEGGASRRLMRLFIRLGRVDAGRVGCRHRSGAGLLHSPDRRLGYHHCCHGRHVFSRFS